MAVLLRCEVGEGEYLRGWLVGCGYRVYRAAVPPRALAPYVLAVVASDLRALHRDVQAGKVAYRLREAA